MRLFIVSIGLLVMVLMFTRQGEELHRLRRKERDLRLALFRARSFLVEHEAELSWNDAMEKEVQGIIVGTEEAMG